MSTETRSGPRTSAPSGEPQTPHGQKLWAVFRETPELFWIKWDILDIEAEARSAGAAPLDVEPSTFAAEVAAELGRARSKFGPVASLHEGYAVILEEVDEFWEEVRGQYSDDRLRRAYRELVQVAAMAQRTAEDAIARLTEGADR